MIEELKAALGAQADPQKARDEMRFFKCAPGEYGEGDRFIGVRVPVQRKIASGFREMSLPEIEELLDSAIHEHRQSALFVMLAAYKAAGAKRVAPDERENRRRSLVELYVRKADRVNNWDLVDSSAPHLLGDWLLEHREDMDLLEGFAASDSLWKQRIAVMASFAFIRAGSFGLTLQLAKEFLDHPHDLMHKAVGWMLREIGKRDFDCEDQFLRKHYREMPRTMLRYAIEKYPEKQRRAYIEGRV